MPFWLLVIILVTLIALCWGGGYGIWSAVPGQRVWPGLLGLLGLVLFIALVIMFMQGPGAIGVHR